MSIVRDNIMNEKGYTPYCGAEKCGGIYSRTYFNGRQFVCPACGWVSALPDDFIKEYKTKWGISNA